MRTNDAAGCPSRRRGALLAYLRRPGGTASPFIARPTLSRASLSRMAAPPCDLPQNRERRGVVLSCRERSQVRDEQRDIFERRLLVFLEREAEPAGGEATVTLRLVSARPVPSARALRRLSLGRSPRRARGCRVPAPAGRSFEGGPARSTLLLSGADGRATLDLEPPQV